MDTKNEICPKCGGQLYMMYGGGWDYDRIVCHTRLCDYEIELETTTFPEETEEEQKS